MLTYSQNENYSVSGSRLSRRRFVVPRDVWRCSTRSFSTALRTFAAITAYLSTAAAATGSSTSTGVTLNDAESTDAVLLLLIVGLQPSTPVFCAHVKLYQPVINSYLIVNS